MDCGSKGCRFDSFFLPLLNFLILQNYNALTYNLNNLKISYIKMLLNNTLFIVNYYARNELIWQEGLLIDFIQKKIIDNWVKKFLINSSYLFNEKLVFDKIIKFYLDLIIWPAHKVSIFEFNNVANTLFITIFFLIFAFYLIFFWYFLILIF